MAPDNRHARSAALRSLYDLPNLKPSTGKPGAHQLVGRDDELRRIGARIELLRHGRGGVVLIEGEAGSGKTTLLLTALAQVQDMAVLRATAHQIDHDRPFGVLRDALGNERRNTAAFAAHETARYAEVEDTVALIEKRALARPLVIAVDDAQWADEPSLVTLHQLWRRVTNMPALLLVARRPLSRYADVDVLRDLVEDPLVETILLRTLDHAQVAGIVVALCGAEPGKSLDRLLAKTGGNAFFVTELLSALREERSLNVVGGLVETDVVDVSAELRMIVLRRLGALTPRTLNVLRTAAVLGTKFALRDLAISIGSAPIDLVATIDEALAAGVIHADEDRFAFRHDLVRDALYGDVPLALRAALHVHVARALAASGAAAAQVAPHFADGAEHGDVQAVEWLRRAAAEVAAIEPRTAQRWLTRAVEITGNSGPEYDSTLFELAAVSLRAGEGKQAETLAMDALTREQPAQRRAALRRILAAALDWQDRCLEASAISAVEAKAPDLSEVERIRFAAESVETKIHVERAAAEPQALAVLEMARQIGDEPAKQRVLAALYHAAMWRGDYVAALGYVERMDAQDGPADAAFLGTGVVGRSLARNGHLTQALDSLRADLLALEDRRDPRAMAFILTEIAALEMESGQWDEAVSDAEAAIEVALELDQAVRHDEAVAVLVMIALERNQLDEGRRLLTTLRGRRQFVAALPMSLMAEATQGRGAALAHLSSDWDLALATERTSDLPRYGPDLVRLELLAGSRERALQVTSLVERQAMEHPSPSASIAALRCRARVDEDGQALTRAAGQAGEIGFSHVLAAINAESDDVACLRSSLAFYEDVDAERAQRRVRASMRAKGIRAGLRGRRTRQRTGWGALSDTERSVVTLAADGLTNTDIGSRLFISGRTVERHLTHAYAKLRVRSRVELARIAATHE